MKIKHFAGYGSVQARKVSKTKSGDKTKLVVEVKGNHEWGLVRNDIYDVYHWLFIKFEKNYDNPNYDIDIDMSIKEDYVNENGMDVEVATYTFIY